MIQVPEHDSSERAAGSRALTAAALAKEEAEEEEGEEEAELQLAEAEAKAAAAARLSWRQVSSADGSKSWPAGDGPLRPVMGLERQ